MNSTAARTHFVIPIVVVTFTALFAIQRHGTHIVGRFFGTVMVAWFSVLANSLPPEDPTFASTE